MGSIEPIEPTLTTPLKEQSREQYVVCFIANTSLFSFNGKLKVKNDKVSKNSALFAKKLLKNCCPKNYWAGQD